MDPLRIFLSYPSSCYDVAESIFFELKNQGHHVFFDKSRLEAAKPYSSSIQAEILACDMFLFLITPDSVAPGRYTRTELRIARDQWSNPHGIILPVMLEETPLADIPKYLSAVHIFRPEGNVASEVMMEVARIAAEHHQGTDIAPEPDQDVHRRDVEYVYSPLQLRFSPEAESGYAVSVVDTRDGSAPANAFPIDPDTINGLLWASGGRAAATTRRAPAGLTEVRLPDMLPSEADARSAGQALYQALFAPPLNELLASRLRTVDPQRQTGVRFLINTTDAPDLAGLPWEFLYNPRNEDFMFSARSTPVVRWLDLDPDQVVPTLAVKPPLRVLIAIAAPSAHDELAVGEELHHLDRALGTLVDAGQVEIYQLDHATLAGLNQALVDDRPHVLHFIGHGDFEGDDGVIMLESDDPPGEVAPLSGRRLATLLRNHLGSLRLVFLNSCMGSAVSARNPFGGVAQNLIRRGVPAVIAMQFPIPDAVAIKLARHFYGYLAAGYAVDDALTCARAYLITDGHDVEWGAPALHMRSPDGRLFDFATAVPNVGVRVPTDRVPGAGDVRSPLPSAGMATPSASTVADTPLAPARADRSRSRVLVVLGLIAVGVVGAVGLLFLRTGDVTQPQITEAPPPTTAVPAQPAPQAAEVAAAYQTASALLAQGQTDTALAQLEALGAPAAEVVAAVPESIRLNLADDLYQAAASAAFAEDRARFDRIVAALIAVEPDASVRADMQAQLADMYEQLTQPLAMADPEPDPAPEPVVPESIPVEPAVPDTPDQPIDPEPSPPAPAPEPPVSEVPDVPPPAVVADPEPEPEPAPEPSIEPAPEPPIEPAPAPGVMPPNGTALPPETTYRVQRGDTLWSIAARHFGNPTEWTRIYHANRAVVTNPDRIFPGQQLVLPSLAAVEHEPGTDVHLVVPGESLWRIAGEAYGDPLLWPRIHAANEDAIIDPNVLHPGQVLRIPH